MLHFLHLIDLHRGDLVIDITEYEEFLNKLPSVISSRFVIDEDSNIVELHILSDIKPSPKQLVRDIQSAMLTKYDIRLDHKIISIAQINNESFSYKENRFSLHNVKIASEGSKSTAEVTLSQKGKFYSGIAQGGNSSTSRMRHISNATLDAVQNALDIEYTFILADITNVSISHKKAYLVSISHLFEFGEELLCGSSFVTKDDSEAIVKASLDAINRRLGRYFKIV